MTMLCDDPLFWYVGGLILIGAGLTMGVCLTLLIRAWRKS